MLAVFSVDNLNDSGNGSLRQAILDSESNGLGADTIRFAPSVTGTIDLSSSLPVINGALTVAGPGAGVLAVDANQTGSVFQVNAGANVAIQGLTITGGGQAPSGGGLINTGTLAIRDSVVRGNSATRFGGGFFSEGPLSIVSSTIAGNTTVQAGGGVNNPSGRVDILYSTIFGNQAVGTPSSQAGGVLIGSDGGSIRFSQITGNESNSGGGGVLGLGGTPGAIPIEGSIIAGNTGGDIDVFNATPSPYESLGGNTVGAGGFVLPDFNQADDVTGVSVITVNSPLNDGSGTLRTAITQANGTPAVDELIVFDRTTFDTPRTMNLGSQLPPITAGLTIAGPGQTLLTLNASGGNPAVPGDGFRLFNIDDGDNQAEIDVALSGLTLTGGDPNISDNSGGGGAIRSRENLTVTSSTISGNTAGDSGGGIYSGGGGQTVTGSTISGNEASDGGGIVSNTNLTDETTRITSSTISGNTTAGWGGGVYNVNGLTVITQSTVTANTAPAGRGSGVANRGTTQIRTELSGSIIAGNTNEDVAETSNTTSNSFQSNGHNLIGAGGGTLSGLANFTAVGDQTGVTNPLIGPLADNGGPTQTHAPLPFSPALNMGDISIPATVPGVFSTGVDSNGALLAANQDDPHYTLISQPTTGLDDQTINPLTVWASSTTAGWIGVSNNTLGPFGEYIYRTTFDLTGFDPATVQLTGRWATDDTGTDIRINGVSNPTSGNFELFTDLAIESGFVAGINTLDFVLTNGGLVANPTGLIVEQLTATGDRVDQRGLPRVVDSQADIGAYESQGEPIEFPAGDYNQDGIANAADYTVWRDTLAAPPTSGPTATTPAPARTASTKPITTSGETTTGTPK